MKKQSLIISLAFTLILFAGSCSQQTSRIYTIDEVYMLADSLLNDTVVFEGVCNHLCKHGGRRAFLRGSDENRLFRVESASLGHFEPECINNSVRVKGVIRDVLIPVKDSLQHGNEGQGCETEQKANRHFFAEAISYEIIKKR